MKILWLLVVGVAALRAQVSIEPRSRLPENPPSLRVDSALVLVPVTVVDRGNHPVTGLEKENFRVFDDGVEQLIAHFAMDDEPVAVGVIFDHSGSIGMFLNLEYAVTHALLSVSNPDDQYCLVLFASDPKVGLRLTKSPEELQNRIVTTISNGSTALVDAVVLGLHEVKKTNLRRKALVVVSDGGENNSRYSKNDLNRIILETDALIYSVGIDTAEANFPFMRSIAELSGGRAFPIDRKDIKDLPDIAAKIGLELRNRYVLGFSPQGIPRDGKYHTLDVQLVPPRGLPPLKASWRRGYYAPED